MSDEPGRILTPFEIAEDEESEGRKARRDAGVVASVGISAYWNGYRAAARRIADRLREADRVIVHDGARVKAPTLEESLKWFEFIADGSDLDRRHWDVLKSALDRLSAVEAAFEPVRQWYDSDGEGPPADHTLDKMIGYAVADLQRERAAALSAKERSPSVANPPHRGAMDPEMSERVDALHKKAETESAPPEPEDL